MLPVDLSQLPPPDVVEKLDVETLFSQRKAALISLFPQAQRDALAVTLNLESEPLVKLLQENVYRELLLRQRVNEAARACMVAYAQGADLEHLGALNQVSRLVLHPADNTTVPPTPPLMESDADFRLRIPQAFKGLSVAGPAAAYEFHARSADGTVADASVISPSPAQVVVTILSRDNQGVATEALLEKVRVALNDENVRPIGDRLTVHPAQMVPYEIEAVLFLYPTPGAEPIRIAAEQRLQKYVAIQHRLGRDIRLSAIYGALHVEGVQRVELKKPVADVVLDKTQASFCTNAQLTVGGEDE